MSGSGGSSEAPGPIRRSVFDEYAEMAGYAVDKTRPGVVQSDGPPDTTAPEGPAVPVTDEPPEPQTATELSAVEPAAEGLDVELRRREFAELLGAFRRTAVLVPLGVEPGSDGEQGWLTADFNGIRFILAFSDEYALARYAHARGEYGREWVYQTVLGAKLLDVAVPAAGVPCGVALDCADAPGGGMVFPPVKGIVPDEAAVDIDDEGKQA
ncbi:hypothetical protein [Streptomyces sp. NPDC016845]|uniref:hypothetical protein n=1 Tax=Streptomyces sp. NPDC016845 TaxID=3364972 RepID=UPI00379B793A